MKLVSIAAAATLLTIATGVACSGQGQAPAAAPAQEGQGGGQATSPTEPPPQAGHPSGQLVIWGDVVNFNAPGTPNQCVGQTRFRRGERIGFRMTAIDGGTGEVENTAVLVAHLTYAGQTIDVPMRWRGVGNYPVDQYLRAPQEMWTGGWAVPDDAVPGTLSYTVTATDRFGRTVTFRPFAAIPSQLAIIE